MEEGHTSEDSLEEVDVAQDSEQEEEEEEISLSIPNLVGCREINASAYPSMKRQRDVMLSPASKVRKIARLSSALNRSPPKRALTHKSDILAMQHLQHYHVSKQSSVFERRITCLEWHPTESATLAIGGKNGQIHLWSHTKPNSEMRTLIGRHHFKAGKITGLKYSPFDTTKLLSVSGDGTLQLHHLNSESSETLAQSGTWDFWFTSLDYSAEHNLVLAGDTRGYAHLLDLRTKSETKLRLHKDKLVDINVNICDGNIFATASNDRNVGLWDLRTIRSCDDETQGPRAVSDIALSLLPHTGVINSVCFSPITKTKLLTTSQDEEIRIYDIHKDLSQPLLIRHPHRFYQYLSPFKATWDPLHENIFVCGRYERGDASVGRSVDIMKYEENPHYTGSEEEKEDSNTILFGEENKMNLSNRRYRLQVCQLFDAKMKTLSPLNKFNANGEELASGAAGVALIWSYSYALNPSKPLQPQRGNRRTAQTDRGNSNSKSSTRKRKASEGENKKQPPVKRTPSGKLLEQFCYKKGGGNNDNQKKGGKG